MLGTAPPQPTAPTPSDAAPQVSTYQVVCLATGLSPESCLAQIEATFKDNKFQGFNRKDIQVPPPPPPPSLPQG